METQGTKLEEKRKYHKAYECPVGLSAVIDTCVTMVT